MKWSEEELCEVYALCARFCEDILGHPIRGDFDQFKTWFNSMTPADRQMWSDKYRKGWSAIVEESVAKDRAARDTQPRDR